MPLAIEYEPEGGPVTTTTFTYDGDGRRVKKQTASNTVIYVDDTYEIRNGQAVKYIFAGSLRLANVSGSTVRYYHKDHLGSSTVITDENGTLVEATEYLPYGQEQSQPGFQATQYKFTDQEYDPETGLYNYDARLYDPVIGRFVSADSIVQNWYDPQALNRYCYARNNPLKYIDPDGHAYKQPSKYLDPISGKIVNEPPQKIRPLVDIKIGKSFRLRFDPLTFSLSVAAGRIPGIGLPAGVAGPKTGPATKANAKAPKKRINRKDSHASDFDTARRRAFKEADMTDPNNVRVTKVDPKTGTAVEFKGPNGAKIEYDSPHPRPGPGHDKPHVGFRYGKGRDHVRGNITYDGPQHPYRSPVKGEGSVNY